MADYGENLSGFDLGDKGGSSASTGNLDAGLSEVQKRLAAMDAKEAEDAAAASAKKEEEEGEIISTSERIETRKGDISALKSRKTIVEDITFSPDANADEKANAAAELKVIDKRIIEKEAEQKNDLEKGKLDLKKLGGNLSTGLNVALGGTLLYEWLNKEDAAAASADETARRLSEVTADREFNINREIGNYGAGFATDALQDADLAAEWDAAGSPDFNTWVQSVMSDPSSPTARKLAEMLDPYNVEAKERDKRIKEASEFYNEYDASQFQSPEMQAAQSYASGLTSDPLSMQNRQYMEQELAGDYSQGFYDDLRADLFSSMHPNAVGTSLGMTKAALGAESAIRGRRDAASDRIARDDALRMSYAPSYASIAASGSADPLSLSNVGKMGIGNIEPMDPTGAFFGSFPAMEYDTNLAAYQRQPTTIQTLTALGQAAQQFTK
mgnify:CR=1 FL=1|jgi:hypothetical protein